MSSVNELVQADEITVEYPTYAVGEPEKHPLFFEKRVYQGSNGKVYPLPFIDKVYDEPELRRYQAIQLENRFVRVLILPDFGGRIHAIQDKSNHDYDIIYHQKVIKPALVGLAGPWISGGIEFNWPQHHRPGTFMPVDWTIERGNDGSATAWMSEHDPLGRLKGMHGLRLTPESALVELRVRLFNRTPYLQTFLWWANAAVKTHEDYRSFFPPDVHSVADHAKRAITSFPIASGQYYGIDYDRRPGANNLTSYKDIPVPTSYMVVDSAYGFLGGFDHQANGGFVYVADPLIAPGKKQWTWGHAPFGRAWDRELCDDGAPYLELMGGVYTDNQPDFSYLHPYETKTFSQFWWPIQGIGPVVNANRNAAIRFASIRNDVWEIGFAAPRRIKNGHLVIEDATGSSKELAALDLDPGQYWRVEFTPPSGTKVHRVKLIDQSGRELLSYKPEPGRPPASLPEPATEPKRPSEISSSDQLFLVGEHLEQYRHPTRDPEPYWEEAVKRDPGDYRSRIALARRCIARFEFREAVNHLSQAVERLSERHPNPITGEAHYYFGLALRFLGADDPAEKAFGKASWDRAWFSASKYELALSACRRGDFAGALDHLQAGVPEILQNNLAAVLLAITTEACLATLQSAGNAENAGNDGAMGRQTDENNPDKILKEILLRDPLDHWANYEAARREQDFSTFLRQCRNDAQTILDLAFNYLEAGLYQRAIELLELHKASPVAESVTPNPGVKTVMVDFLLAWLYGRVEQPELSNACLQRAQEASPYFLFPSRAHESLILEWAITQPGSRRNAAYGLGNLYYDRRRPAEAIKVWESGVQDDPLFAPLHRNLGLAYLNQQSDPKKARQAYERAVELAPSDARLAYEYDQLRRKLNDAPAIRLAALEKNLGLVLTRDDFCVEYVSLLNLQEQYEGALELLTTRRFHPWEGGEGKVLAQYRVAQIGIGRKELGSGKPAAALEHFNAASQPPPSLGEEFHYLQARSDLNYWKGQALEMLGHREEAEAAYKASASEAQDFKEMAVTSYSAFTYYRGLSLRALARQSEADQLFASLRERGRELQQLPGTIDYFATSLPNMLVFEEDLTQRNRLDGQFLEGLALLAQGDSAAAKTLFAQVLQSDASHYPATDQLRSLTH
jgi:tetratricopeptide (TPR) repeat protein